MQPLIPGNYYHIYNHAVGFDNLFLNDDNYQFFLKKYILHIYPIAETYAYCLMPNHFHISLRIRDIEVIESLSGAKKLNYADNLPEYLSKQFSNFFNAYSKAVNKVRKRRGSLFCREFKRKLIDSDEYFKTLIHYIHYNPVHHGFVSEICEWKHSSFESFFTNKASKLERQQVIDRFGGLDAFNKYHQNDLDESLAEDLE